MLSPQKSNEISPPMINRLASPGDSVVDSVQALRRDGGTPSFATKPNFVAQSAGPASQRYPRAAQTKQVGEQVSYTRWPAEKDILSSDVDDSNNELLHDLFNI